MNSSAWRHLWPDRVTWIVGLGSTAGLAGQSGSPWMVNALTASAHFNTQQAGLMVTAEMIAMGGMMIAIAPVVHRIPAKPAAAIALATMVGGEILSANTDDLVGMTIARAITGLAFGLLFALASAFGARAGNPARTYAVAGVIALLIGTTINPLLGYGLQAYGHAGVFGGLALLCAVVGGALLLIRFPARSIAAAAHDVATPPVSAVATFGVMTVMGLLAIATNGVFVFLTTIAAGVGLAGPKLGAGMAVVSLVSALGGVVAAKLGNSQGILPPLVIGLLAMAAALFSLTEVQTSRQFWVAFTFLVTLFWFLWPYIFGLAVSVDAKGRVAAATGSAKILAGGLGSGVSGIVTQHYGLPTFGIVAAALCGAAVIVALLIAKSVTGAVTEPMLAVDASV